tara:strand:- start:641 stop:1153 length:513 start_codon:yes stop_codon:yes gene_type:complete
MKKLHFAIFYFLFINVSYADTKISYIDIDFILKNSVVGKAIINKIKTLEKNEIDNFNQIKEKIKKKNEDLNNKKNILSSKEFNDLKNELNIEYGDFLNTKNEKIKLIKNKEKEYSNIFLKKLNPILTKYVEDNDISILISKKNIIIAKKENDITSEILTIFNNKIKNIEF